MMTTRTIKNGMDRGAGIAGLAISLAQGEIAQGTLATYLIDNNQLYPHLTPEKHKSA